MKTIIQCIDERLSLNKQTKVALNNQTSNNIYKLFNDAKQSYHWMDYPHTTDYKKVVYNNVSIFFPYWHGYTYMKLICDIFEKIIDNNKDILKDCTFIYTGLLNKHEIKNDEIDFKLYAPSWDRNFKFKSLYDAEIAYMYIYIKYYDDDDLINGKGVGIKKDLTGMRGKRRKIVKALHNYVGSQYDTFGDND